MTMTKRKGQTTDIKAPQKRSLRSRKREAVEEDDPLTEQKEQIPVTETNTQDSDINSTSQNASVSELTLQEHTSSSDSIGNIDSSKPELKETGDTITQCVGVAHLVSTKGSQSTHSTNSAEPTSSQSKTSHQTSSLCDPEPPLDGEAVIRGHAPTMGEEKVGGEVVSESRHQHSQEGEEATDVPGEERPWLGCEASSQGTDGEHPTNAPARKKVRRRMGMGRLVEKEKKNPLDGQNCGRRGRGDGGEKERETDGGERERETDGGEKERETDEGAKQRETDGDGGVEVNDGPTVAEKEETVHPGVVQSDAPLEESSKQMETEQPGGRGGKTTEQPETVAITTSDCSRAVLHSEKVTREKDPNYTDPSKVASCEEQRYITPLQEIQYQMELEVQQKHMGEDSSGEVKPSRSSSAIIKSTNKSTGVGEESPGNQIQDPAVTVATATKHSIPDGLLKVEDAHNVISDVLKSTEAIRTPECDEMSIKTKPSEPTVPSSGKEDSIRSVLEETPVPAKGHDPVMPTHIIPDLSHDRNPFDPLSGTLVSDSQLNDITLIMELEDQHGSESSRGHEDATELVCGLISELSSLNRTIMAAHRELDSLRRGNRNARTPQRRPLRPPPP